jgi:hypothetical protein
MRPNPSTPPHPAPAGPHDASDDEIESAIRSRATTEAFAVGLMGTAAKPGLLDKLPKDPRSVH